ncbi:HIG1 domain family member 1A, mitochondrial-like [Glandiceps talaboti]
MSTEKVTGYEIETGGSKFWRKAKEDPFVPIGIAGLLLTVGWGAISYRRHRKQGMSTSIFLMRFRVFAQSAVVGSMTVGVVYHLYRDYFKNNKAGKKTS